MRLDTDYEARLLKAGCHGATGWRTETWVIHESGEPGRSLAQVDLFSHKGEWVAWDGCITRPAVRALAKRLADIRNREGQ